MAEILIVNLPYAGHTNPTLPLAKGLVDRSRSLRGLKQVPKKLPFYASFPLS